MLKNWISNEFEQRDVIDLIVAVEAGRMSPEGAAKSAERKGLLAPDKVRAEDAKIFQKSHWSLPLAVAWMMTRNKVEASNKLASYKVYGKALGRHIPWEEHARHLLEALAAGQLTASGIRTGSGERVEIAAVEWNDLIWERKSGVDYLCSRHGQGRRYDDVLIPRSELMKIAPELTRAENAAAASIAAEKACVAELVRVMRADSQNPIPKNKLREAFPQLPARAFNRAYTKAAEEAGTPAWRAAGRRPRKIEAREIETPK